MKHIYLPLLVFALIIFSGCTSGTAEPIGFMPNTIEPPVPPVNNPTTNPPVQPPIVESPVGETPVVEQTLAGPSKITATQAGELKWTGGYADASVVEFKGKYWMYLNQFGNGKETGVFVLSSSDGETWKNETGVIFPGIATVRALVIGDKVYAYYPQGGSQIGPNDPAAIIASVSSDGKTFTSVSGMKITPHAGYTMDGPGVFQLDDGTYRMYFVEFEMSDVTKRKGDMWGASSSDGKTWVKDSEPTLKAEASVEGLQPWPQILHPFIVKYGDGFIMFYNSHSRIFWAYSEDGFTWEKRGLVTYNGNEIDGADVDGFWMNENELRIFYGDFSHETGGLIYETVFRVE